MPAPFYSPKLMTISIWYLYDLFWLIQRASDALLLFLILVWGHSMVNVIYPMCENWTLRTVERISDIWLGTSQTINLSFCDFRLSFIFLKIDKFGFRGEGHNLGRATESIAQKNTHDEARVKCVIVSSWPRSMFCLYYYIISLVVPESQGDVDPLHGSF